MPSSVLSHLDLEAVLWLESYLQSYRHTVIVVSHDRAFLNEVCTDTVCHLDYISAMLILHHNQTHKYEHRRLSLRIAS